MGVRSNGNLAAALADLQAALDSADEAVLRTVLFGLIENAAMPA